MGITARWRGRVPVALLTAGCLAVVGLAVGGATGTPKLELSQSGHWVLNSHLGKVFHIDGGTKRVDAEVAMPDAERGSLVVQSDTSGYVVGRGKYTEFGKSTLRVEGTTAAPTDRETPVVLEVAGGAYLVYREAGQVVRLGEDRAQIPMNQELGNPVVTADGTLWLHATGTGNLCQLPKGTTTPSCPATVAAGHAGGLTVVGDQPVFVDTTADTMQVVGPEGLGRAKQLDNDLPDTTKVGAADVTGRVPLLDPSGTLYLVDTADVVGERPAARDVVVRLAPGDYTGPESTGSTVAVLERRGGTLLTYDSAGVRRESTPVPVEQGAPRLTKGEDSRVYVEGGEGRNVLVVDKEGAVTPVPVDGTRIGGSRTPEPPPAETTTTTAPAPSPADPQAPVNPQPQPQPKPRTQTPVAPVVVPASPPGAPGGLVATPGSGQVALAWGAAAANGAPVTAYRISWNGGGTTVPGGQTGFTATGLANGTTYTFTVVAENSAGAGPGATAQATPRQPVAITISRGATETFNENCQAPDCSLIYIELTGFPPNSDIEIQPYSTKWGNFNTGATTRTDARGYATTERFHFAGVGQYVWVIANGVESNHLYWEDR